MSSQTMDIAEETKALAAKHGLYLTGEISFNETGLDFRVGFATDSTGRRWVLRIPRRGDAEPKIALEGRILDFVRPRLPVEVPDWQIRAADLVAYPMLADPMALVFDAQTYEVTWHIDPANENYVTSLAEVLVALHSLSIQEAHAAGIAYYSAEEYRAKVYRELERVRQEIGIGLELEVSCRRWLDNDRLWPDFSVLTHGDLYAGHVTATEDGWITGMIDWTEAEIGDPAVDFSGHLAAFDSASLARLVAAYERAGGRTWPNMMEHITQRHAAAPIKYALFAMDTGSEQHLAGAKVQLGIE